MKFAFSTAACRDWDFQTIATRAAEMKYPGVELHGSFRESDLSAGNLFLTDTTKLATLFADQGIQIACIASPSPKRTDKPADLQAADHCRRCIDAAASLNCHLVKIPDSPIPLGQSDTAAGIALGDWLVPLGDYAAQRNVGLALENAQGNRSAHQMWLILDRVSHPSIGICWNILNATLINESPFVSVPTLSSRIEYAIVSDAKINSTIEPCPLGEGDIPIQKFLNRLRGIGYQGWLTLSAPSEELPDALTKLQTWTHPPHKPTAHAAKH